MLTGVEFCYSASTNVVLTLLQIVKNMNTSGPGSSTIVFSDATARTDTACRLYTLTTLLTLTAKISVSLYLQVQWNPGGLHFGLNRTTFVLAPTTTTAAPPSAPQTFGTDQQTPLFPGSDSSAP
jgi:hypothetical protein